MKVAYLVAEFPKPSETFVSREVLTLERLGTDVLPFAFRAPRTDAMEKLDPETRLLAQRTSYLSPAGGLTSVITRGASMPGMWRDNARLQRAVTLKKNPAGRLLRAAALARQLERAGATHLHAHWPYATQVAYLAHQLTGIPFSVSIHAHEVEHDHGHFPVVFEALQFATFCNRAAMERLLERLPAAARAKSHLVYHGVDLSRFAALPFPAATTPLRVISAGRLTPTKGFDRLVRACARFHASGQAVELTILGEGPVAAELKTIAQAAGFADHLHLPGWLPHSEISARLEQAHLFALMADTNFHDGLPNVLLEAMSSARPVVLSPLPAAGEAVADGVEGFVLTAAQDEEGLFRALCCCAAAPEKLKVMGAAARRRMTRAFDQDEHARRLQKLFTRGAEETVTLASHDR